MTQTQAVWRGQYVSKWVLACMVAEQMELEAKSLEAIARVRKSFDNLKREWRKAK